MYESSNDNERRFDGSDGLDRSADYMGAAHDAYDSGDHVLAMHLFLTAYEQLSKGSHLPDALAITALREAWSIACELGERSIAEYSISSNPSSGKMRLRSLAESFNRWLSTNCLNSGFRGKILRRWPR